MNEKRLDGGQNSDENKKAKRLYREWYASLNKEEKLRAPQPEKDDDVSGMDGNWVFAVDEARMKDGDDYVSGMKWGNGGDEDIDSPPPRMYTEDEMQEVVRRVVMAMQMSEHPDVLFQARCILIALGIGEPPTESELARLKGCSRQFVSKKVKRIQALFNLSPSQYMRSDIACKAYSKAYWSKRREQGGKG